MPTFVLETLVDAPLQRVFDLARHVDRHTETMGHDESVVDATADGHLALGDVVTWRATHFAIPFELTVQVTQFDNPSHFRDKQIDGPFGHMVHDHYFERTPAGKTRMRDEFDFASPLGPLGRLVDELFLASYLESLVEARNRELKALAEDGSA